MNGLPSQNTTPPGNGKPIHLKALLARQNPSRRTFFFAFNMLSPRLHINNN